MPRIIGGDKVHFLTHLLLPALAKVLDYKQRQTFFEPK